MRRCSWVPVKFVWTPIRPGARSASSVRMSTYFFSPCPRNRNCASSDRKRGLPRMRSRPFWYTMRALMPKIGTRERCGMPNIRWSAALQRFLPDRSSRVYRAVMMGSVAGFHSCWSIPFTIPTNRSRRLMNASWRPNPPAAVRNSCACDGLTVVTASANAMPPLSRLTRPYHSSCAKLYSSQGSPSSAIVSVGKCPWKPALCTVSTDDVRR